METRRARFLAEALRLRGIEHVVLVPASGLDAICEPFAAKARCIYATREEEAVAIAAGLVLAGGRPAVLMAQAGVGNALNAVFTLADAYGLWFPIVVCFRGREDPNRVQRVSAQQTHAVLAALGGATLSLDDAAGAGEFDRLVASGQRWIACSL